ncbi:MAG: hypothetical protein M0P10_11395, partial [Sphaerochaetaceae bacterium]|nr:hypothetical protein [Sphaerochaetaceae bacterium]
LADPSNIGTDNLDIGMDLGVEFASGFTSAVGVYVPFDSFTNIGQFGNLDNYKIHGSVGWTW